MSRPFAVFDIDGTIIRWQLYHAIGEALAAKGIIKTDAFDQVSQAKMNWKQRGGEESFKAYEFELVKVFDEALSGLKVDVLAEAADEVFEEYKEQVYTYTRDLIRELKAKNYLLFAISGSPSIIVKKLADFYGFDDYSATDYPSQNGRFLGTKDLALNKKAKLLRGLVDKHGAVWGQSIGVGDSEGDIDMLELVEQPIVMNPSKLLFRHAREHGWKVVLERKNMIYELELKDGSYVLAKANA